MLLRLTALDGSWRKKTFLASQQNGQKRDQKCARIASKSCVKRSWCCQRVQPGLRVSVIWRCGGKSYKKLVLLRALQQLSVMHVCMFFGRFFIQSIFTTSDCFLNSFGNWLGDRSTARWQPRWSRFVCLNVGKKVARWLWWICIYLIIFKHLVPI